MTDFTVDFTIRLVFSFLVTALAFSLVLGALSLLASDPVAFVWVAIFAVVWGMVFTGTKVTKR